VVVGCEDHRRRVLEPGEVGEAIVAEDLRIGDDACEQPDRSLRDDPAGEARRR
jgi:hypothetical protein